MEKQMMEEMERKWKTNGMDVVCWIFIVTVDSTMLVYMVTRKTLIQKIGYNMATTFGEYQANLFASSLFGPQ